jgi:hypothetical protein
MLDAAALVEDHPPPPRWTPEAYLAAAHPRDGRGHVGVLTRQGDRVASYSFPSEDMGFVLGPLLEQESFVTLNRYRGRRGGERRLAALGALWLDLDIHKIEAFRGVSRDAARDTILSRLGQAALPAPSFLVDS